MAPESDLNIIARLRTENAALRKVACEVERLLVSASGRLDYTPMREYVQAARLLRTVTLPTPPPREQADPNETTALREALKTCEEALNSFNDLWGNGVDWGAADQREADGCEPDASKECAEKGRDAVLETVKTALEAARKARGVCAM